MNGDNKGDDIIMSTTTFDDRGYMQKSFSNVYDFSKRKLFSFYGYVIIIIIFLLIIILSLVVYKYVFDEQKN